MGKVMKQIVRAITRTGFYLTTILVTLLMAGLLIGAPSYERLDFPVLHALPFLPAVVLLFAIVLMEVGIIYLWPQLYFPLGIPVMGWNYRISVSTNLTADFAALAGTVPLAGLLSPQVKIKPLTKTEYGL
jgi:hypothetical protein